ncbi:MAG: DUF5808 domain-containing protein [Verrucomicrobiota bacterium]
MSTKLPPGTLDKLWAEPKNWRAHFIYVCQDDPRVIVPKRNKWRGWTLNFAHGSAWLALVTLILAVGLPLIYLAKSRLVNTGIWYAALAGIVVITGGLCWFLSSPRRYEKGL